MATEKNTAVCVEKVFWSMHSRKLNTQYLYTIPTVICATEVELMNEGYQSKQPYFNHNVLSKFILTAMHLASLF